MSTQKLRDPGSMNSSSSTKLQSAVQDLVELLADELAARVVAIIAQQRLQVTEPNASPKSSLQQQRLLRCSEVTEQVGLSKSSIYRGIQRGTFPYPIKYGHSARWIQSDITAWIEGHR
jgi:prophage regulatory protein